MQASVYSPLTKHVRNVVPCCLQTLSPPCVSNTFGMCIFVCVRASVSSTVFQTRGIVVPCLGTSICLLLPWSNTFVFFGSLLCTNIRLHPCLKHVQIKVPCLRTCSSPSPVFRMLGLWIPVCAHASVSSLVQTRLIWVACLFTSISVLSQNGYGYVGCSVLWDW